MEDRSPREQFPRWTRHVTAMRGSDLREVAHEFCGGFTREHELVVLGFIEENYLRKYRTFLRVDFDWLADGLWGIPFPGSVYMGISVEPGDFGISGPLAARIEAWQAAQDRMDVSEVNPDPEATDAGGLATAKEVKLFLGDDHYVEFRPFQEIPVRDGEAVELEVPGSIAGFAG